MQLAQESLPVMRVDAPFGELLDTLLIGFSEALPVQLPDPLLAAEHLVAVRRQIHDEDGLVLPGQPLDDLHALQVLLLGPLLARDVPQHAGRHHIARHLVRTQPQRLAQVDLPPVEIEDPVLQDFLPFSLFIEGQQPVSLHQFPEFPVLRRLDPLRPGS